MTELCPVWTYFKMRYLCPYLPLLFQTSGCKAVLPVACGSHTINPCPVLNIIKIMPEQCMVNGGFAAVQPG